MASPQNSDHPIPSPPKSGSSSSHPPPQKADNHTVQPPPPSQLQKPAPLASVTQNEPVTRSPMRSPSHSKTPVPPRVATARERTVTTSPAISPEMEAKESPARSLLRDARKAEAMHQKERSFSSVSSSLQSPHRDLENPTASSPLSSPMSTAWTVASVLHSPAGDTASQGPFSPGKPLSPSAAVANMMVTRESQSTGNAGVRGEGGKGMLEVDPHTLKLTSTGKAAFMLRILAFILSMISFSVMASDKTSGWDGDSFDRYAEFRYCLSVNVLTFVYSTFQIYLHIHNNTKMKQIMSPRVSCYFDFSIDQILAYLLISASSSAASRNGDWISDFGSDKFTKKINGSVAMSFLSFFTLASSSIISADKLFSSYL